VQAKKLTEVGLSTVFWTSILGGAVFSAIGIMSAGAIASFFHEPRVKPLVMVLSLSFLITSLGSTHRSLLARRMDFRSLELRFLAGVLVGAAVGITAALAGLGPWALILQEIALAAVSTGLLWLMMPWRPRRVFSFPDLRSLGVFGLRSVGGSLFGTMNQNADNLLVGKVLGASALGIYSLAYSAILLPLTRIVSPIQQVLFPAFSRIQHDPEAMGEAWLRTVRIIAAAVMPLMLGLIICAPDVIPLAFGQKWISAVRVVQVLALASVVQCIVTMNGTVLLATGAARIYLRISAVTFLLNLGAFAIGLKWGVLGVASAYTVCSTVLAVGYTVLTARSVEVPLRRVVRVLSGVSEASFAMVVVTLLVRTGLGHQANAGVRVGALVLTGAASYGVMLCWRDRVLVDDLRAMVRRRGNDLSSEPRPIGGVA
jgi:polysaccharide transporter, PST family